MIEVMCLNAPDRLSLPLTPTRVVGILNVTPDSFSDGGRFDRIDAAVDQAVVMFEQGADVIDIGGESTRPGAVRIDPTEQIRRVVPVIEAIHERFSQAWISIDTTRADVAEAALAAGACMVNDVSGGREDDAMFGFVAQRKVPIVLMHMQGEPATMQDQPQYTEVVAEVRRFLLDRAAAAECAGINASQIVLDVGLGFGKTTEHNLQLLGALQSFVDTGHPIMLGASRKRFLGPNLSTTQRLGGTIATTVLAAQAGVSLVRVHDVQPNRQAIELVESARHSRQNPLQKTQFPQEMRLEA